MIKVILILFLFQDSPAGFEQRIDAAGKVVESPRASICCRQNGRRNSMARSAILVSAWEQRDGVVLKGKEGAEEGKGSLACLPLAPEPVNVLFNLPAFNFRFVFLMISVNFPLLN